MERREQVSAFAAGGRQRLQERSDEAARARTVQKGYEWCGSTQVFSALCGLSRLITVAAAHPRPSLASLAAGAS